MLIKTHIPTHPLNELIECFVYFKGYMPEHSLEKVVPDGSVYLIFELDGMPRFEIDSRTLKKSERTRAWISGMQTNYITISALPDSEMFVIKFKPYGAFPLFNCRLSELNNRVVDAEKIFGESVFELRDKLLKTSTYMDKIGLVEAWLSSRFNQKNYPKDFIVSACNKIKNDPSLEFNSIAGLISEAKVSKKHFVSLFKKYVGLTPKQLQRIFRFNEILSSIQKEDKVRWVQIALNCGYYDQAHFIKEFKEFCGTNPSKFIIDYKDLERVNFFPLD